MIRFCCPSCGAQIAPAHQVGRKVSCAGCGARWVPPVPKTAHYTPSPPPPAQQSASDRLLFAEGDLLVTPTHLQGRTWSIATAAITDVVLREDPRLVAAPRRHPGRLVALVGFALLACLGL